MVQLFLQQVGQGAVAVGQVRAVRRHGLAVVLRRGGGFDEGAHCRLRVKVLPLEVSRRKFPPFCLVWFRFYYNIYLDASGIWKVAERGRKQKTGARMRARAPKLPGVPPPCRLASNPEVPPLTFLVREGFAGLLVAGVGDG